MCKCENALGSAVLIIRSLKQCKQPNRVCAAVQQLTRQHSRELYFIFTFSNFHICTFKKTLTVLYFIITLSNYHIS